MTKSIQQVNQELKNLESASAAIAVELEQLHLSYLELLDRSLKQQLIAACFQICTRLYPQSFLDLSLSEKQQLQQKLRQLSIQLSGQLGEIIAQKELEPEPTGLNLMALIKNLPKIQQKAGEDGAEIDLELVKAELKNIQVVDLSNADPDSEVDSELQASLSALSSLKEDNHKVLDKSLETNSVPPEQSPKKVCNFENPEHLILWHKQVERNVRKTLDSASRKVNKYFQESEIIPNRIPSKIIEVAIQADARSMKSDRQQPNIPHVIHLAVENGDSKSKSAKEEIQISLLRLRLAELEFSEPLLNAKRSQIRNLMGKIRRLNGQYKATKREAAVIEAQAAWRASWYED